MSARNLEERLRAATNSTAAEIEPGTIAPLSLADHAARTPGTAGPGRRLGRRPRLLVPLAAAAAVIAVIIAAVVVTSGPASHQATRTGPATGASPSASAIPSPTPTSQAAAVASVADRTSLDCDKGQTVVTLGAMSGDPVADCDAIWDQSFQTTAAPPALTVYADGGWVTVLPSAQQPPGGAVRLPSGFTMNASLVDLSTWLQDYDGGLMSSCFNSAAAVAATRGELARLKLTGWTVLRPSTTAEPPVACISDGIIMARQRQVRLLAGGARDSNALSQLESLAAALAPISSGCDDLPAAQVAASQALARLRLGPSSGVSMVLVSLPGASCTSVHLVAGDGATLTLIGPPGPATSSSP
jgi:hypothetical protein